MISLPEFPFLWGGRMDLVFIHPRWQYKKQTTLKAKLLGGDEESLVRNDKNKIEWVTQHTVGSYKALEIQAQI